MYKKNGCSEAAQNYSNTFNYTNQEHEFAVAIEQGTGAVIKPIADDQIHRFDDPNGKPGNRAGWYVLHSCRPAVGAFGNWRTGQKVNWFESNSKYINTYCQADSSERVIEAKRQREKEKYRLQELAAVRAAYIWEKAHPATKDHPYLNLKNVDATGLKKNGQILIVPIADTNQRLVNLQFIHPNGNKHFLKNGKVSGCFFLAGADSLPQTGQVYVCEGVATGLTIWQLSQLPVVCALHVGNLKTVVEAIKRDGITIIIAADNDHKTKGNPGLTKASLVSNSVGTGLTWPPICGPDCVCTDFNDIANCKKYEEV